MKTTATVMGLALLAGCAAYAQAPTSDQGVARLSLVEGSVSTQRGSGAEWTAGAINTPLLGGDTVATTAGARTEVTLDFADVLRLNSSSQATITNLTTSNIQVNVSQGMADYAALAGAEAAAELDTPNLAVHPHGQGLYRIQVNGNDETVVIARQGEADITTPAGSTTLHAGQMITVDGTDDPQYQIADASPRDGWDDWNQNRDNRIEEAQSWSHANRYYTGVNDLDGYGHWVFVPGYGQVWQPAVAPGWTPYSTGSWVYEPYWGWTWVSTEPWGWAPFHYGRWFFYDAGWVWWPGPVMVTPRYRPVWAPAYVAFVGMHVGGGVNVGVGFGSVGWVPIGPGDVYRPWWGGREVVGVRVVEPLAPISIRVRYSNLSLMYTDVHVRAAVVAMPSERFGHGPVVVHDRVTVAQLRDATVMRGELPMAHPRAEVNARGEERPMARPATRPGFQRFGGAPAARAGEQPAARSGYQPPARTGQSSQARPNEARPNAHANDPSWHKFQPQAKGKQEKPAKKDDRRGGGGLR